MMRAFFFDLIVVLVFVLGVFAFMHYAQPATPLAPIYSSTNQLSAAAISQSTSAATSTSATSSLSKTTHIAPAQPVEKAQNKASVSATPPAIGDEISRIQNPYPTAPESFDAINTDARSALVNILCAPQAASSLDPISGSGVIIDPRGVILTNAHVAQYVLLSEISQVDLQCVIRTGSPARSEWGAAVLYIPPVWVTEHAGEILQPHPTGTGEHDYALLYITNSVTNVPLPSQFPYLPIDTRPGIAFPGDQVLVASYPAEFVGGIAAQYDLYADSSVTTIQQLLTFGTSTPDAISLGGIIEAQSGSSGGAVVNAWGRLVGIVTTTSSGTTTADRDLRAISLSYIDSDLELQSGESINGFLASDPVSEIAKFNQTIAPKLAELYLSQLSTSNSGQ